jgi:hypothetical protein
MYLPLLYKGKLNTTWVHITTQKEVYAFSINYLDKK